MMWIWMDEFVLISSSSNAGKSYLSSAMQNNELMLIL